MYQSWACCNATVTSIASFADSGSCMEVAMQDRHQSNEQAGTIYGSAPLHVTPQGGAGTPPKWVAAQSASPRAELASDEQMVPRVSQPTGMHSDGQAHGSSSNESHKVDPGGALPSDDKSQHNPAKCNSTQHDTAQHDPGPLPVLASACPGWVCYAEKTHGSYILPYISTTKSPQVSCIAPLIHKLSSYLSHDRFAS